MGGTEDPLFPPLGQKEATRQIAEAFNWAGSPDLFRSYAPAKPHCYDQEIQEEALAWFNKHLKGGTADVVVLVAGAEVVLDLGGQRGRPALAADDGERHGRAQRDGVERFLRGMNGE